MDCVNDLNRFLPWQFANLQHTVVAMFTSHSEIFLEIQELTVIRPDSTCTTAGKST